MNTDPMPTPDSGQRDAILGFLEEELHRDPSSLDVATIDESEPGQSRIQIIISVKGHRAKSFKNRCSVVKSGAATVVANKGPVVAESAAARISPIAYLRSMWTILWSTFRSPFTVTMIDLSTGRVMEESPTHG